MRSLSNLLLMLLTSSVGRARRKLYGALPSERHLEETFNRQGRRLRREIRWLLFQPQGRILPLTLDLPISRNRTSWYMLRNRRKDHYNSNKDKPHPDSPRTRHNRPRLIDRRVLEQQRDLGVGIRVSKAIDNRRTPTLMAHPLRTPQTPQTTTHP